MAWTMAHYRELQEANEGYWFDINGILYGARAKWMPIHPEMNPIGQGGQPAIVPHMVILHTNAGAKPASIFQLWSYIRQASVTGESHFQVDNSGAIGQYMAVTRRADCNYSANSWTHSDGKKHGAIAVETGDLGAATVETTPWNMPQLQGIVAICTASAIQHGTGCNEVLKWDGHGIDYHTKFPYRGIGYPAWTNVRGKTCPGKMRKLQTSAVRQIVAERVGAYMNGCKAAGIPHLIPGLPA